MKAYYSLYSYDDKESNNRRNCGTMQFVENPKPLYVKKPIYTCQIHNTYDRPISTFKLNAMLVIGNDSA